MCAGLLEAMFSTVGKQSHQVLWLGACSAPQPVSGLAPKPQQLTHDGLSLCVSAAAVSLPLYVISSNNQPLWCLNCV